MFSKFGFATLTLIFSIGFLCLVMIAIFIVLNPLEKAAQLKDEMLTQSSVQIFQAIEAYQKKHGKLPWADDFGSDNPYTPLPWTRSDRTEVGVCGDLGCSNGGDLVNAGVLDKSILNTNAFEPFSLLYVGKAPGARDLVNICFVPGSEKERKNIANLYKFKLEQNPIPAKLASCDDNVRWEDEDVCWKCAGN